MVKKIKLTEDIIKTLTSDGLPQKDYPDALVPGLSIRVAESGAKSWTIRFAREGERRRMTLGRWPQLPLAVARDKAVIALREAEGGNDPQAPREKHAVVPSMEHAVAEFRRLYVPTLADTTQSRWNSLLDKLEPRLATLDPSNIPLARREIRSILRETAARSKDVARTSYTIMRRIVIWGIREDLLEHTAAGIFIHFGKPEGGDKRTRILAPGEIRAFWEALEVEPVVFAAYWRTLWWSGQRRSEVQHARWPSISPEWLWTLTTKGKRHRRVEGSSTGGKKHVLPFARQAREFLQAWKAVCGQKCNYVFPGKEGRPISGIQKSLDRIRKAAKLSDVQLRDIRKTISSGMAQLRIEQRVISMVLSHTIRDSQSANITGQVYTMYAFLPEMQEALQRWADHLDEIRK